MAEPLLRDRVESDLGAIFSAAMGAGHALMSEHPADALGLTRYRGREGRLRPLPGASAVRAGGTAGRLIYAVGDVHGRYDLLLSLLAEIVRDQAGRSDRRRPLVIFLGDYVDRGPDSALVLEALLWLERRAPWRLCLLKGNHEQALLDFADDPVRARAWLQFGGCETFAAYGLTAPDSGDEASLLEGRDALLAAMPAAHLHLLQRLDLMAVVGDYAFVHAGVAPGTPLASQREADLLWIRGEFLDAARPCDKVVVHGHTWTSARPALLERRIGIDTGAYETGVLTAVRLDGAERAVLQARDPAKQAALVARPADFTQGALAVNLQLSPPAFDRPLVLERGGRF